MASTRKKNQIAALQRKSVTVSTRARVSTSRVRKATKSRLEESFLQNSSPSVAMASSSHSNFTTTPSQPIINHQPDVIIDMLRQLTQSNQFILERIERIEQQVSSSHQTTVAAGLPTISQPLTPHSAPRPQENHTHHALTHQPFNSSLIPQLNFTNSVKYLVSFQQLYLQCFTARGFRLTQFNSSSLR